MEKHHVYYNLQPELSLPLQLRPFIPATAVYHVELGIPGSSLGTKAMLFMLAGFTHAEIFYLS